MMSNSQIISKELEESLEKKLSAEEWIKVSEILKEHSSVSAKPAITTTTQQPSTATTTSTDHDAKKVKKGKSSKVPRPFNFQKYNTRHVALKITYLGWDYHGFVVQEDSNNTVEHHLFEALTKTKLIESRQTSNYSRCGRTDKGVSAFGQVIAIDLRTNLLEGLGVIQRSDGTAHERKGNKTEEINYPLILNRVLPNEIRIVAWTPVEPGFNARFDTLHRTYKYFFPAGDLDTELMNEASEKLVGTFDFRNFCKMDVGNGVVKHVRTIRSAEIRKLDDSVGGYQMYEFTISGLAFLYHQVRCITAILFLIGQHKEKPEIIDRLLDVESEPCKPQYPMATDFPLLLHDCAYDGITWIYDEAIHERNILLFQEMWTGHMIRASMMHAMIEGLTSIPVTNQFSQSQHSDDFARWCDTRPPIQGQATSLVAGYYSTHHKPLLDRQRAESLENRIEHFAKRRKVEDSEEGKKDEDTLPGESIS